MSQLITIEVRDKIASCLTEKPIVCGNSDYEIHFDFDEEWNGHEVKTAVFTVNGKSVRRVFTGSVCRVPELNNTLIVWIGVFAGTIDDGTLSTSTPALVHCIPCATDGEQIPLPPPDDVYNQIVELCDTAVETANDVKRRADEGEFDGKDGAKGKDGADGKTAYQYAVDGGYDGTEKDFTADVGRLTQSVSDAESAMRDAYMAANDANMGAEDALTSAQNAEKSAQDASNCVNEALNYAGDAHSFSQRAKESADDASKAAESILEETEKAKKYANNVFANALKGHKSGATISADDVSPIEHELDIKVKSKNIIPFPYAYQHREIGGLTVIHNADGSLVFNGTSPAGVGFFFKNENDNTPIVFQEDAIVSLTTEGVSPVVSTMIRIVNPNGGSTYSNDLILKGSVVDRIYIQMPMGTYENFVVKPQLEYGTVATEWTSPLTSVEGTKVRRRGKNFFNIANVATTANVGTTKKGIVNNNDGTITVHVPKNETSTYDGNINTLRAYAPNLEIGKTYTLNAKSTGTVKSIYLQQCAKSWKFGGSLLIDDTILDSKVCWYTSNEADVKATDRTATISEIQIEESETPTDYEPYFEPIEVEVDNNGVASGVVSVSPSMYIDTDNENACIECEYNRDINKAFDKISKAFEQITQAMVSMGANI